MMQRYVSVAKTIVPITSTFKDGVLCTDCLFGWHEHIASILDPTYDKTKEHYAEDIHPILTKLWCWPNYNINDEIESGAKCCPVCTELNVPMERRRLLWYEKGGSDWKECPQGHRVHR